jgi:hypothetical protein
LLKFILNEYLIYYPEKSLSFHNTSYDSHIKHLHDSARDESKLRWDVNTVNHWRQERLYQNLDPLLTKFPDAKWLTIGDFYFGSDARYIQSKGVDVTASEIDDKLLREAYNKGEIKKFSQQNAEALSFGDDEFDFTFCKETLHHLPRPFVGLYEILRVSKIGVMLIEPYDRLINPSFIERFNLWLLKMLKGPMHDKYEPVGNYKYSFSLREFEKAALGLNYDLIAYKYMNDYFAAGIGIETEPVTSPVFKKVKNKIARRDLLWKFRIFPPTYIVITILRKDLDTSFLTNKGFSVQKLTKNPYL